MPSVDVDRSASGIAEAGVDAPQDDVDRYPTADSAQPDPPAATLEVRALDERIPELGGDRRVLERGLRQRTRREDDDRRDRRRPAGAAASSARRRASMNGVNRCTPVARNSCGKHARQHPPVLDRVRRTRRRLGAVPECEPAAVGRAGQIGAEHDELLLSGDRDPVAGPSELGIGEDHLGRHQPRPEQSAFPVQVAEHEVEEFGPLDHPAFDAGPFVAGTRKGMGSRVQERRCRSSRRHVVGHAVLFEQALDLVATACHLTDAHRAIGRREARPRVGRRSSRRSLGPDASTGSAVNRSLGKSLTASVRRLPGRGGGGRACASTRTAGRPRSDRVRRCRRPRGCVPA